MACTGTGRSDKGRHPVEDTHGRQLPTRRAHAARATCALHLSLPHRISRRELLLGLLRHGANEPQAQLAKLCLVDLGGRPVHG